MKKKSFLIGIAAGALAIGVYRYVKYIKKGNKEEHETRAPRKKEVIIDHTSETESVVIEKVRSTRYLICRSLYKIEELGEIPGSSIFFVLFITARRPREYRVLLTFSPIPHSIL